MKRGLVVQGGGAKFAYVAGELAYHIGIRGHEWDEYYGTSAGALVALLASANDPSLFQQACYTMDNNKLWSDNPLRKNGKVNFRNAAFKLLRKKDALGSTGGLRKQLEVFYPKETFERVRRYKTVSACVSNFTTGNPQFGSNQIYDYDTFLDFVWASTCVPIMCEPVDIADCKIQDGGVLINTPIQQAIDNGCDEIDVFFMTPEPTTNSDEWQGDGMMDYASRTIDMMHSFLSKRNMIVSTIKAKNKNVKLRLRYTPYNLCKGTMDAMDFSSEKLKKWYEEGYNYAKERGNSDKVII